MMSFSFLLCICVTLSLFMNFSPAFHSDVFGNETDRLALLEFKNILGGALGSWNDSDHCSWIGVVCNHEHPRRVTVLDLSHQELGSSFRAVSPDIGNLTFLMTLRLGYNGFYGEIPQEIGSLFRLRFLNLSYNYLYGEIPSSLRNCLVLKGLYLNGIRGIIPPSLQSLRRIQELILDTDRVWSNSIVSPVISMLSQEITAVVSVEVLDLQRRGALKSFKAECEAAKFLHEANVTVASGNHCSASFWIRGSIGYVAPDINFHCMVGLSKS